MCEERRALTSDQCAARPHFATRDRIYRRDSEDMKHVLILLAVVLMVIWVVARVVLTVTSVALHLLWVVAIILAILWLIGRLKS